jgi:hypothetical protein
MLNVAFLKAVEAVISIAKEHGIEHALPSVRYTVQWFEQVEANRSIGKTEEREEPSFSLLARDFNDQIASDPSVAELTRLANEFVSAEGKLFPWFFRYDDHRTGSLLLGVYFNQSRSLVVHEETITAICKQFEEDLQADTATARAVFQVRQFGADEMFSLAKGIIFRPVTSDDVDRYGRGELNSLGQVVVWLDLKDWICEVEGSVPKNNMEGFNNFQNALDDIIVALGLTTPGRAQFSLLEKKNHEPLLANRYT